MRAAAFVIAACSLYAQPPAAQQPKPPSEAEQKEIEEGLPVTSEVVRTACGACHKSDDKQRMTRISYRRTTPEGWQQTIKRMLTLNGVKLTPEEARAVVKYLADEHGLAPEELKPGAFEVERRLIDYKYEADRDTEQTCIKCHSFGRVLMQRRTKGDWELLLAMHRGFYPLVDFQSYRRMGPVQTQPGPDGRPPDNRHPMDKAVAHLSSAFPLRTPEWSNWIANKRTPKLDGRWLLTGHQTGKGPVYGEVTIKSGAADEFTTAIRMEYALSGERVERQGKAIVYTGFQWRGRSMMGGREATGMREVLAIERNQRVISGRWFMGDYDETGIDVRLQRIGGDPIIAGLDRKALPTGATDRPVSIYGANLGSQAFDFGPGVTVKRTVTATPSKHVVVIDVAKDAKVGERDVVAGGAILERGAVVFEKVDVLKVRPIAGMARVGGNVFPKMFAQFEAIGYSNGADGKPDTKDDLDLGMADVAWSMEEYTATYKDDDREFVGSLDAKGFFTPNGDGPNPSRSGNRNNVGDVWIVATHKLPDGKTVRARAHLLVTVPLYMRFEQPEVAR